METLRCMIVDDEPLALDLLQSYVERTPYLVLVSRCSSAFQAMECLEEDPPDLLFLDIQMPGLSGLDFAQSVPDTTRIVFSTAFPDHALEGYRLDALDYLVKPYDYAEFLRTASKAREWFRKHTRAERPWFFVRAEHRFLRIDTARIQYIEGMKDYVAIHLAGETKPVLTLASLKSMQRRLPPRQFVRIHRSWIVNLAEVSVVSSGEVHIGATVIPIADRYRKSLERMLEDE